jgi:uncharacterized membrane protein YccC
MAAAYDSEMAQQALRRWSPWPQLRRLDPNLVALRRGLRAAVVIPLAFSVARLLIGDAQALIFVIFGCFALLVMADFGGPRRARLLAYLATALAGAVLVGFGTLVSPTAVGAAVAMLGVGLALSLASILGGYPAAAQPALLLAFVISVSLPAPFSEIPAQVAGWSVAGLVSTLAAAVLWPRPDGNDLPARAADASLAVANVVSGPSPASLGEARDAVRAAGERYAAAARRPSGLSRMDRAYSEMLSELQQVIDLVQRPFQAPEAAVRPCTAEGERLTASVLDALRASAAVLRGGAAPDVRAVVEARRAHRAALNGWVADQLRAGRPAEEVLDGLDYDHTLRVLAYLAIGVGGNAAIAAGDRLEAAADLPAAIPRRAGARGDALRLARSIRTHLDPRSPVLHNSLRLAIGLAVSVFLARTLGLGHAFWVVLGTLQVLRTSALGTGRTTIQALIGNALGVAVGGLFAALVGTNSVVMWATLPFTVFFAAYAATTVGFVLSQAAFTVNLIILFNLISPAGWQVGLVRIEDVAVGAAVSVVAGVLLWPRGARREVTTSVSSFYGSIAAYLAPAFDRVLGFEVGGDVEEVRRRAVRARDRAGESLHVWLSERGTKHMEPQAVAALIAAGNQGMLAADALTVVADGLGFRAETCADAAAAMRAQVRTILARLTSLADRLEHGRDAPGEAEPVGAQALRAAALACLRHADGEAATVRSALALVSAREWAQNLARLETDLEAPVDAAAAAARIPWWR